MKKYPQASCIAEAFYLQGDIYRELNRFTEAVNSYQKVLPLQKDPLLEQSVLGVTGDCYFALASSTDRSEHLQNAVLYYEKLLNFNDVTRENMAMVLYRLARCYQLLKQQTKMLENLKLLLYLLPPDEIDRHPLSTYWVVKGVNFAEQIALQSPLPEQIKIALQALNWLERSGIQNAESVHKRVRNIRKKQQSNMKNTEYDTL